MAPTYNQAQVAQFLTFLQIPKDYWIDGQPFLDLAFLTLIHQHMIATVPFENLTIHYSAHRQINLDPEALFKKIVVDGRGRGGYCMEGNLLLCYMLHAIGYNVYPVGVRARLRENGVPTGGYLGWYVVFSHPHSWTIEVYVILILLGLTSSTSSHLKTTPATSSTSATEATALHSQCLSPKTKSSAT